MSFQFPNSPTIGATYTPVGGYQYVWDGTAWRVLEAPQLFATAQARNRIVNGAMQISQENGDTAGATSAYYPADQWVATFISGMVFSVLRSGSLPASNSKWVQATCTTAKASLAASDFGSFGQQIEGVRIKDFQWGTASAKQVVLRFWAYTNLAGTYTASLRNSPASRSYVAPFTMPASVWTLISLVIPGDTTGTWAVDTSSGIQLGINWCSGTTFQTTANSWQAGNFLSVAGAANLAAATSNAFFLGDVGLYLDPDATGRAPQWQMPDEAEELRACQRYWAKQLFSMQSPAASSMMTTIYLPVPMRINPTVSNVSAGSLSNATIVSEAVVSTQTATIQITATAAAGYILNRVNAYSARM